MKCRNLPTFFTIAFFNSITIKISLVLYSCRASFTMKSLAFALAVYVFFFPFLSISPSAFDTDD